MKQPTNAQVWNQVINSIRAKHMQGKSEQEVFATIDAHQMDGCTKQDCFLCRTEAEVWCLMNHTEPRRGELLC